MLRDKTASSVILTKKELFKKVRERLSKVYPEMGERFTRKLAKRAVKVLKRIQDLPRYSQVINMTHKELNLVLQECPESPYFTWDKFETKENQARQIVLAFIERARYGRYLPLEEAESFEEVSHVSLLVGNPGSGAEQNEKLAAASLQELEQENRIGIASDRFA